MVCVSFMHAIMLDEVPFESTEQAREVELKRIGCACRHEDGPGLLCIAARKPLRGTIETGGGT